MKIIDLTIAIDKNTPVFPGDPKPEIKQIATITKKGWNEKKFTFNSHFSTHIDAPFHMLENGKKLDEFSLETFIGNAIVLELNKPRSVELDLDKITPGDIVFFYTRKLIETVSKEFLETNSLFSEELAQKLIEKQVKIVGLDYFSPDVSPFTIHKLFFKNSILIVENLVNLEQLIGKRFQCYVFPLKIKDADGAPCRVMAILE